MLTLRLLTIVKISGAYFVKIVFILTCSSSVGNIGFANMNSTFSLQPYRLK